MAADAARGAGTTAFAQRHSDKDGFTSNVYFCLILYGKHLIIVFFFIFISTLEQPFICDSHKIIVICLCQICIPILHLLYPFHSLINFILSLINFLLIYHYRHSYIGILIQCISIFFGQINAAMRTVVCVNILTKLTAPASVM